MSVADEKRAKPCWAWPLTVVNSPPTNSWVPSVAETRGPRPPDAPPLVFGYQAATRPVVASRASRCRESPRAQPTSGNASGSVPMSALQSWACEPL